jgi:hypothetical protein
MTLGSLLAGLRRVRAPGALVALALFLLGTNFCLVGMTLAAAAPSKVPACHAKAASRSSASHCGATATGEDSAPSRRAPCCEALAPVTPAEAPKAPPASVLHLLFHFAAPATPLARPSVVAVRLDVAPLADESPPADHAHAPLSSRAPPLA